MKLKTNDNLNQVKHQQQNNDKSLSNSSTMQAGSTHDVLLNNFQIKKQRFRVLLNGNHLVWERLNVKITASEEKVHTKVVSQETEQDDLPANYGSNSQFIHINEMICIGVGHTKGASLKPTTTKTSKANDIPTDNYLSLHYAERINKSRTDCNRWRVRTLTLYMSDAYVVRQWHETLLKLITTTSDTRLCVRRLLVFINPYGGRKRGLQTYEKHCKPLFELAGIDASCIISQRANQIRDILLNQDLAHYDAICCIGGDGTVAEVINGLIFRKMRDLEMDLQHPAYVPKPNMPVGIIPAGSTDTIAFSMHGTSDATTAAIHIVLGQRRGLDICSVRNSQGLDRFCASLLSYGYLGDVAAKSEKYRWMGTKRYEYAGVKAFLRNRGYDAVINVPPTQNNADDVQTSQSSCSVASTVDTVCTLNCIRCRNSVPALRDENASGSNNSVSEKTQHSGETLRNENCDKQQNSESIVSSSSCAEPFENWHQIQGTFFMISGTNISCSCTRSPHGISPYNHLGDGYLDLILVRKTSLLSNVRLLINSMSRNGDLRTLPFVEAYRTKQFKFHVKNSAKDKGNSSIIESTQPIVNIATNHEISSWNCDGEVVMDLDITMICHCQLIDVFMRGPGVYTKASFIRPRLL